MRYALNVTPINGWETHLASGQGDLVASATGDGYRAFYALGLQADMALQAQAAGYLVITGLADDAATVLTASGSGMKAVTAEGLADHSLSAVGIPILEVRPVGESVLALTVNGQAVKALIGSGLANQTITVLGSGHLVITGLADDASMTLDASGSGYGAFFAIGETAILSLSADGYGYRELRGIPQAAELEADADGVAVLYMHLIGNAGLDLTAVGAPKLATVGSGQSDMLMSGLASIPSPIVIPVTFSNTHYSRRLEIEAKDSEFTLADDDRRMIVPPEARVFAVPAEREI
jgi:hypothetical protein